MGWKNKAQQLSSSVYVINSATTQLQPVIPTMVAAAIGAPHLGPLRLRKPGAFVFVALAGGLSASVRSQASSGSRRGHPRRIFLGLGASLLESFGRMATGASSSGGGRSFAASARPQQGASPVEQVALADACGINHPMTCCPFI